MIKPMLRLYAPRRVRRGTGIVAAVAMVASVMAATPAFAEIVPQPTPDRGMRVEGGSAAALESGTTPASSISASQRVVAAIVPGVLSTEIANAAIDKPLTTSGGARSARVAGGWQPIGQSGIEVGAASTPERRRGSVVDAVEAVRAQVLSSKQAESWGLRGLVVSIERTDGLATAAPVAVRIPDQLIEDLYGADYAGRIRWVQLDQEGTSIGSDAVPVSTAIDEATEATVLTPSASAERSFLVAASTTTSSDGTGSYAATPLNPSALWDVSTQTGDFTWSYPLRTPPAAAGPAPQLSFQYDAQSVDGKTGSSNNQTSSVGEGWSLNGGGYIERSYVSCSSDDGPSGAVASSGDLCWKNENATAAFAGQGSRLIRDTATGEWRLQDDDGSRVEHLVGTGAGCGVNGTHDDDCWRITTTDGTQYYFGLNRLPGWTTGKAETKSTWTVPVYGNDAGEPCHASTFAASFCTQAWRWNLDYVVDVHGNAQALYYNAETNSYAQNGGGAVSYVRGGDLEHIDYGFTDGNAYATNAASDRVVFNYASTGRCSDATGANCSTVTVTGAASSPTHPSAYPDVPFDLLCSTSCPTSISPSFWSNAMLEQVTTSVLKGGSYSAVDKWVLGHSFPDPGDGTDPALWLTQITHTGLASTPAIAEPPTIFTGIPMQNRVWPIDGLAPLDKYRIASIATSGGAVIQVTYSDQECTPENTAAIRSNPETNSMRCYPQWWTPDVTPPQAPQIDLFHKYVVTSVASDPRTGGGLSQVMLTQYVYTGTPAWRYDNSPLTPPDKRTWSVFAGYDTVEVRVGAADNPSKQEVTEYSYFRGLDGDRATASGGTKTVYVTGSTTIKDALWFAGRLRAQVTRNGVGGSILSTTTDTPWASAATANDGTATARFTGTETSTTTEPLSTGSMRTSSVDTTFDAATGLPLTESHVATGMPSTCTITEYAAPNAATWVRGLASRVTTVAKACPDLTSVAFPADAVSDARTSYDGGAVSAAATRGLVTKIETVDGYSGVSPHWVTVSEVAYDSMGRPISATDALGHIETTAYTPAAGAPVGSGALTSITATSPAPFNWTTTTTMDPAWGVEVSKTDPNGRLTSSSYDALGRLVAVWAPDHAKSTYPNQPSVAYAYSLSTTVANWVSTSTLVAGAVTTGYVLYDGLGRQVQTQAGAEGGGAVVSDQAYDFAGRVYIANGSYWAPSVAPSGTLFVPLAESQIPSKTVTEYDGAGRPTARILQSLGAERFRTTLGYVGADRVDTTPPVGGTPNSTYSDAAGQTVRLVQYLGSTVSSSLPQKQTTYEYDVSGRMIEMTDPAGNEWTWTYDLIGRQIEARDPDAGTTSTTYDAAGNVLTVTDAESNTIAYSYDSLNRQIAKYEGSTSGPILSSWTFDTIVKGQPTSTTQYVGSTASTPGLAYTSKVNSYDAGYRPTSSTVSIPVGAPAFGGTSYTTTYTYYTNGAVSSVVYPAMGGIPSERVRYGYTAQGRVSAVSGLIGYGGAEYTAIGQLAQVVRFSTVDLYTSYGYDPATGAVLEVDNITEAGGVFTEIRDTDYSYDDVGNVRSIISNTDIAATDTQCFGFDALRNLTEAWTPGSGDCAAAPSASALGGPAPYWNSYDVSAETGNRLGATYRTPTTSTTDSFTYPAAGGVRPHAAQSVTSSGSTTGTQSFGYDDNGATTTRSGQALMYDAEGRLSTLTTSAGTQSNVYDATGKLLLQVDPVKGATLYLGDTQLRKPVGSSSVSAQRIYSVAGTAFVERSTDPGASGVVWLATDPQGTVGDQVNSSTGARAVVRLDPYGRARGSSSSAWADGRGFLNAPVDTATGLIRLGVRLYDSTLGRFLSVDPVLSPANPQQSNGYSYAANNPVTYSDASGACYLGGGDTCVHDRPAKKNTGTTTPPSSSQQPSAKKDAPAKKAAKQEEQWWNPFSWSANTWQDVGAVAAGVVAGVVVTAAIVGAVACTAVTFGVCAVAVTAVALAAGGAVAGGVTYALQSGEKSDEGMLQAIGWGAVGSLGGGAFGSALGAIGSKIASAAAPKIATAVAGIGEGATSAAAAGGAGSTGSRLARALADDTGSIGLPGARGYRPSGGASDFNLDELAQMVSGHAGVDDLGRPGLEEIRRTLNRGAVTSLEGQNAVRVDYQGVRVIINEDLPWRSTAYYPGR